MLTNEQIENNKNTFITLVKDIKRDGVKMEDLITKLSESDFFIAPASTKYNNSYAGGLCEYCLNVYYNLTDMLDERNNIWTDDTLIIIALFHVVNKMNYYTMGTRNKKVYSPTGMKSDSLGNFDWVTELSYEVREDRFVYSNDETTAEYMVRHYIPLTTEESVAILHYKGAKGYDSAPDNIIDIFMKYPLAMYLHMAVLKAMVQG